MIEILDNAGAVINRIVASEEFAQAHYPGRWRLAEVQPEPQPTPLALRSCTPAQGLVALYAVKQITEDAIRAVIDAITDPGARYTAKIGYERATAWEEGSPTMLMMQTAFNLSASDMDELFDYAVQVKL